MPNGAWALADHGTSLRFEKNRLHFNFVTSTICSIKHEWTVQNFPQIRGTMVPAVASFHMLAYSNGQSLCITKRRNSGSKNSMHCPWPQSSLGLGMLKKCC
ncbi:hypothetical protein GOP47_0022288 [Adiantum capillus-veneris]|uniref:Uncharacterized protein n=1 Tax=Adiantum capillus-veneris TaxID=13818 RepID=A0A9D4U925_ADICA|nr:hypothetical protein GOP47_0022288 [Adiantum capillus-veneris]